MNTKSCVLVTQLYNDRSIDGSIINAFEYFYTIFQYNKEVKLVIQRSNLSNTNNLINFLNLKYNIDKKCFENIEFINNKFELFKYNFDVVFCVCGYSTENYAKLFKKSKVLAMPGYFHELSENVQYFVEYPHLINSQIFKESFENNDFSNLPENIHYYKQKLRLDLFKEINRKDNGIFLNSPHNLNVLSDFKSQKRIYRRENLNTPNMFEYFDEMIYIQNPKIIDRKPRSFFECLYFDIPFTYIFNGIIDGSYYRSKDFDLKSRIFDCNDEIVKLMI